MFCLWVFVVVELGVYRRVEGMLVMQTGQIYMIWESHNQGRLAHKILLETFHSFRTKKRELKLMVNQVMRIKTD